MKLPLQYQTTEYDCTPTTFTNALRYLLERKEIDPFLMKQIITFSFDGVDESGNIYRGTSTTAIKVISDWLNSYCEAKREGVQCKFITSDNIDFEKNKEIKKWLNLSGVVLVGINLSERIYHNVLVTGMDEEYVYVFDPYIMDLITPDLEVKFIDNKPYEYNRQIAIKRFNHYKNKFYSMGSKDKRECVLIKRLD